MNANANANVAKQSTLISNKLSIKSTTNNNLNINNANANSSNKLEKVDSNKNLNAINKQRTSSTILNKLNQVLNREEGIVEEIDYKNEGTGNLLNFLLKKMMKE